MVRFVPIALNYDTSIHAFLVAEEAVRMYGGAVNEFMKFID